jgi:O-antigen/teichoic acid export membrane protein
MSRARVARNAAFSMAQVVLSAAALLVTYWLLMRSLPIAEIGLWSLVVGTTLVARLSEMGLGSGVLRFVAGDLAAGRPKDAARTIGMAGLAVTVLVSAMALALQPFLLSYLLGITPAALHPPVAVLLPAALLGVVLTASGNVFLAAIDGCQRVDLRACLQIGSSLIQLGMTWYVLPRRGVAGLGLVQVVQAGSLLVAGLVTMAWLLRRPLRDYFGFEQTRFRELLVYGGGLQVAAIAQLLFEPLLKVLLTSYSGLALTGYFDMANRIVMQFRSVIVAAYTALVPHVAALAGADGIEPERLRAIYRESFALLLYVVLPYFACLAASLPLALTLWKGQFDPVFLAVALLQCGAWLVNSLSLPSYMLNTGTGELRWNIAAHVMMGLAMLLLGPVLGGLFGGTAVLVLGAVALAAGSLLVPLAFHRSHGFGFAGPVQAQHLLAVLLVLAAFAATIAVAMAETEPNRMVLIGLPILTLAAALVLGWTDPLRDRVLAGLPLLNRLSRQPRAE